VIPQGTPGGTRLGVGLWGASRGFLAHWAVIQDLVIRNYQIAIPSRVNAGTQTPALEPGPLEKALLNTPVIESRFTDEASFRGIDLVRTIQSFDPCMNCSAHLLLRPGTPAELRPIETGFPI
jgi:hydrogenase large subunit